MLICDSQTRAFSRKFSVEDPRAETERENSAMIEQQRKTVQPILVRIDFRGIQDDFMRSKGIDYFENSRATYIQQKYAVRNPKKLEGYNKNCWVVTASAGPGPAA